MPDDAPAAVAAPAAAPAFSRELDLAAYPRMRYQTSKQRPNVLKGVHLGQRKLLLSEMEFLTLAGNGELFARDAAADGKPGAFDLVVYAGAAPGGHTPFLQSLFAGSVAFVLIDPAPFDKQLVGAAKAAVDGAAIEKMACPVEELPLPSRAGEIVLIRDFCTPVLCGHLRDAIRRHAESNKTPFSSVLFVSDIRVGDMNRNLTNAAATAIIMQDNDLQQQCCEMLEPDAAMLKFRPPFPREVDAKSPKFDPEDRTPDEIHYYAGRVFFGVWAPKSSTEVRLVVTAFGARNHGCRYNCRSFEEQMCFYNAHERYKADVESERAILQKYVAHSNKKNKSTKPPQQERQQVLALSKKISAALYDDNDLFQPLLPPEQFSESDARLWALIFVGHHLAATSATDAADKAQIEQRKTAEQQRAVASFQRLRAGDGVTMEKVLAGDNATPTMQEFWAEYGTATRIGEFFQFLPWVHGKLVKKSPHHHQHHNNSNSNSNNKKNELSATKEVPKRRDREN